MRDTLETLSYWARDYWKVILLALGVAGVAIAAGLWMVRNYEMPAIDEQGEVVRFGAYSSDEGPLPAVVVRMRDGRTLQLKIHRSMTHHCRAGSTIRLVRRGDTLTVHPQGCAPPPS